MKALTSRTEDVKPNKMLPTLYKKTSTGADQMWSIGTYENIIITQFGQVGGKIQETHDIVKTGKNLGRSNETTAKEQAELEAKAQWEKKKTAKGYVESLGDARKGKRDALVKGGIDVMLAHRFDEQGHKIIYPAYLQPKLDGHRCIAIMQDGKCTLWSRTRKPINSVPHINRTLEEHLDDGAILDGELYAHDYRERFEELTSLIRPDEPKPGHEVVQYHVYDAVAPSVTPESQKVWGYKYGERLNWLLNTFDPILSVPLPAHVQLVGTVRVDNEDDMMLEFEKYLAMGYEGGIVRNAEGLYENKRSYNLQKIKEFTDEEFVIVGIEEGRGKLEGHGIFVCKTRDGVLFKAKLNGPLANLRLYHDRPEFAVGKLLTVKFQGYTTKNGVPRFPVALRMRENI